jgi:predicted nucleic acid-binding protein
VRTIVSNTGPLLHLHEAQALTLLSLAGSTYIPPSVETEVKLHLPGWQRPTWLVVTQLEQMSGEKSTAWQRLGVLDSGEADALSLAQQLGADWFLTDDTAARLLAQSLDIEVHGSLGVVLWAAATQHLTYNEAKATLNQLAQSSLWLSAKIYAEANEALNTLFDQ